MLKPVDRESVSNQVPELRAPCRHAHQTRPANTWLHKISMSIARCRQRGALEELARLDRRLLQDIGISKAEALREAAKPFWLR